MCKFLTCMLLTSDGLSLRSGVFLIRLLCRSERQNRKAVLLHLNTGTKSYKVQKLLLKAQPHIYLQRICWVVQTSIVKVVISNKCTVVYLWVCWVFLLLFTRDCNIWEEEINHKAIMFIQHQEERKFVFETQRKFSASLDWPFSQQTTVQQSKANTALWQKQPPDFRYQICKSSNLP